MVECVPSFPGFAKDVLLGCTIFLTGKKVTTNIVTGNLEPLGRPVDGVVLVLIDYKEGASLEVNPNFVCVTRVLFSVVRTFIPDTLLDDFI